MIYVFLATGFEEVEALTPVDMLRRAGLSVTTVGVGGRTVVGSHGIPVVADIVDVEYHDDAPDMIILPGGIPGTPNLESSPVVMRAIENARMGGGYLAAICAAPTVFGRLGLLEGKKAVCYPGMESELRGAIPTQATTVRDGKLITSRGMGTALEFALVLIETLVSSKEALRLRHAVVADK